MASRINRFDGISTAALRGVAWGSLYGLTVAALTAVLAMLASLHPGASGAIDWPGAQGWIIISAVPVLWAALILRQRDRV